MLSSLLCATVLAPKTREAVFEMEDGRSFNIVVRLDQAPLIGGHFLGLVRSGFYDGLLIHRKVPDFVVQTGDPNSRKVSVSWAKAHPGEMGGTKDLGDGGSGKEVPFEINDLVHEKHTVGMALSSPMSDTGDSQIFINLKSNFRLNGMYVVFGKVEKGTSVVDSLERGDRIKRATVR